MKQELPIKSGKVALVGRPNAGKSTLLNNLIGKKVAIVSPKAQTTQSRVTAVYEDDQCQIFFKDTPGYFASKIGKSHVQVLIMETIQDADIVLYVVDHTRQWGLEEAFIKNLVVDSGKPIILVINKTDVSVPSFKQDYKNLMKGLVLTTVEVSALKAKGINTVLTTLLPLLPEGNRDTTHDEDVSPLLSHHSHEYLEELIREKIFLLTEQEVPYQATPCVTSVNSNEKRNTLKIKAHINTTDPKYKAMLIGKQGKKIKEIMDAVKIELGQASKVRVFVELKVK